MNEPHGYGVAAALDGQFRRRAALTRLAGVGVLVATAVADLIRSALAALS